MRRGQSAVEFALITVILLFIFTSAFAILQWRFSQFEDEKVMFAALDVAGAIQTEAQVAYETGSGYSRTFYVPQTLGGVDYAITYNPNTTANSLDELVVSTARTQNVVFLSFDVQGTIQKGWLQIDGGNPVTFTPTSGP